MKVLDLLVSGLPKAQPRAKAARRGGFVRMYTPGTADDWKGCISRAVTEAIKDAPTFPVFTGAVRVDITVIFPRIKGHFNSKGELKPSAPTYHTVKPDRDNCDKAVLDTLTACCVWRDDAQVCDGRIIKRYAATGEATGARIHIIALE